MDVELYEIVATLDALTSEICQEMDGKVFKMSGWEIGATAPPFHVNCRTTTCPAFGDEFDNIGERAAKDKDGKTYYVPSDMTYKQWEKGFVDGDKSGLQEIGEDDTISSRKQITFSTSDDAKKYFEENGVNEWVDSLTDYEVGSIGEYTGSGFQMMNKYLRGTALQEDIDYCNEWYKK